MSKYYFSFGQTHTHKINGVLLHPDVLLEVDAESEGEARERVFASEIGDKFFTSYSEERLKQLGEKAEFFSYFPEGVVRVEGLS